MISLPLPEPIDISVGPNHVNIVYHVIRQCQVYR